MPRADAERLRAWELVRRAVAVVDAEVERRLQAERGQDLGTYRVLAALVAAGGPLRMHELAEQLVVGRPTATRMCDRLEAAGLLARVRREDDGRAVMVSLTRAGREEYRRCQPAYERFVHDAFARHVSDTDVVSLTRVGGRLGG